MGRRHQAFLIARLLRHNATRSSSRFRCIAAFHHQWCYDEFALRAARRFLTLVKQPNNAEIVRAELRDIQRKYGVLGEEPLIPDVPCPYTAFLLASSWTTDLDPGAFYTSGTTFKNSILPASMGSTCGDNNDGITVIDVTDPGSPAYCFVAITDMQSEDTQSEDHYAMVPLSAEDYLGPVTTEGEEMEDDDDQPREKFCLELIKSLRDEKMVTYEMLASAWPHEYTQDVQMDTIADSPSQASTSSPVDMAVPQAVNHALDTGETMRLEELMRIPDKLESIKSTMRNIKPFPDSGIPLLKKVMVQEMNSANGSVDLSGFALSGEQVLEVLSSLDGLRSLDISGVADVTGDMVRQVLKSSTQLKRLVVLGCESVTDADLRNMLTSEPQLFYNLHALIHPSFHSGKASYRNAFSYISLERGSAVSCSLPYFSPTAVVQGLTDLLRGFPDHFSGTVRGFFAPQSAFSSAPRNPEQKWGERSVICHPPPSLNALRGEGWAFVISSPPPMLAQMGIHKRLTPNIWGFVRTRPGRSTVHSSIFLPDYYFEVHDLRSFLAILEEEGRPAVAEEVVSNAEKALRKAEKSLGMRLATELDLREFIKKIDDYFSRYNV